MAIDLSTASADELKLILLKVPVKDLIKSCTQVSKQWNGILEDNDFWRKKMEEDGYLWQGKMCENGNKFEWKKSAGISTKLFKWIALKHCFERNFLKDNWNLEAQYWEVLTLDPRWKAGRILQEKVDMHIDDSDRVRVEIPPKFVDDQPEIPQPIPACIAIPNFFSKYIVIKLADEGLTDEIMDNFRPTIFISEIFGNRRDCNIYYIMQCSLHATSDDVNIYDIFGYIFSQDQCGFLIERRDENGRWVRATIAKQFKQGEAEGWHRMEYALKDYPAGMRYLYLRCMGYGHRQNPEGHCGLKLAKCSVMALCEKNAPE